MKPEEIKKIQEIDTLAEAELITGKSYKDDETTVMVGLALNFRKSEVVNMIMEATDDTLFRETVDSYIRKTTDFGFEIVLREEIKECKEKEEFIILWHREYSILISFDTYRGGVNGGNFYYNWSPFGVASFSRFTSSGGFEGINWLPDLSAQLECEFENERPRLLKEEDWDEFKIKDKEYNQKLRDWREKNNLRGVWVGYHDCREAVKNNITLLLKEGEFLKNWKQKPFLWLAGHSEYEKNNWEEVTKERLNKLPDFVKNCIN